MTVLPFGPRDRDWRPADSFLIKGTDERVVVFEDRANPGDWRVEYNDREGGCYVTLFSGPQAERRARVYFEMLKGGSLSLR